MAKKNTSGALTFLITALTLAAVWYTLFEIFNLGMHTDSITWILILLGIALSAFSLKISPFNDQINKGFLWTGVILFAVGIITRWDRYTDVIQMLIIFGSLGAVLLVATKFKKYFI